MNRRGGIREGCYWGVSERGCKDKRARMIGSAKVRPEDGVIDWSTGRPMVYCFSTCVASIRTIPVLQHDSAKPEDLDMVCKGGSVMITAEVTRHCLIQL